MAFDPTKFFNDTFTNIGMGILASNRPGSSFGQAVGGGGLLGLNSYQQMLKFQQEREDKAREQQALQANQQWMANQGFAPGTPQWAAEAQFNQQFAKPDLTTLQKNLAAAGLIPDTPQYRAAMMRAINKPAIEMSLGPKAPTNYQWIDPSNPDLGVKPIVGGPAEKPTEGQLMAEGYAERMSSAAETMSGLESKGFSPSSIGEWAPAQISNYLASEDFQNYRTAQEDWVRAKLRKESGAVIGDEEMSREISVYFPVPGDSTKTIEQKARQRATAERAMAKAAGPQYERKHVKSRTVGPSVGDVENGYRFKGGNPANPASWEKVN